MAMVYPSFVAAVENSIPRIGRYANVDDSRCALLIQNGIRRPELRHDHGIRGFSGEPVHTSEHAFRYEFEPTAAL